MSKEYWGMAALAVASILFVTVFGRPDRPRESLFLFLLEQAISWPLTIFTAFTGRIESPVRLFPKATDSNFIIAFVFLPAAFVAYYWHYPRNKSRILQIAYTLAYTGGIALVHVAVQKYTDLLKYITVSGYMVWPAAVLVYYGKRLYSDWYFGQLAKARTVNPR